ncbi:hypothetical protein [Rodentibacter pneumotropicus]|uniref:hypothetical protein n=1 Tax=Rodentibacter pneumotropicus TaxID=758 RepID=UPI00109CDF3B|nr:hypothetical protein [Rodentibacter pneumotropicus]THA09432.1 hypothetical protein D3M77_02150 [Rodentibacter pneumotropicus]
MLSEKEIEALKNGAFGVSRDGRKARYIGDNKNGSPVIARFCEDGTFVSTHIYTTSFVFSEGIETHFDIVGLWEDKPEPFNLERALSGEPVLLKNGLKGFVIADLSLNGKQEVSEFLDYKHLVGFAEDNNLHLLQWNLDGDDEVYVDKSYSIIGMWKEPEPISSVDDLPKPIREFGGLDRVWFISQNEAVYEPSYYSRFDGWSAHQEESLANGCYYATKEDCQTVCDWLMSR